MNVLFIGGLYAQDQISTYKANSKGGLQFAAQNLQESIIEGLMQNGVNLTVVGKPILGTWPQGYKYWKVNGCDFMYHGSILGRSLGFINLPLVNAPMASQYMQQVDRWYMSCNGDKHIWVYSLTPEFIRTALAARKKYPDIKLTIIVPDLLKYVGYNRYYKALGLAKLKSKYVNDNICYFDYYVLLSEGMAKELNIEDKSYCVMEGIFTPEEGVKNVAKDPHQVILYTGNLNAKYGIPELLKAFSELSNPNYRLWLRGNGECENMVREMMKSEDRIELIPPMSKKELLELQKKATILVNPVSPLQEFTKFFFPSKTMDYLASGTPTLMYKLECMPADYHIHLNYFSGTSCTEMAQDIENCIKNISELNVRAASAMNFIRSEKNASSQVKKILNFQNSKYGIL